MGELAPGVRGLWSRVVVQQAALRYTQVLRVDVSKADAAIGSWLLPMVSAGLLGSAHCIGMCGALVAVASDGASGARRRIQVQLGYQLARLTSYVTWAWSRARWAARWTWRAKRRG